MITRTEILDKSGAELLRQSSHPDGKHLLLLRKIRRALSQSGALNHASKILVGLSGGVDSVVLLHQLCALRDRGGPEVIAAHVHHGLRGDEADRDAQSAEKVARRHGCNFHIARLRFAGTQTPAEHTLRAGRQKALRDLAARSGANRIALAHHQDDQAETVLMRLLGGADVRGLSGMRVYRASCWIRPMLEISRKEIEAEASECGLAYVVDSSNLTTYARRNFIRRNLLPTIQAHLNPRISRHLSDMAESFSQIAEFLEAEGAKVLSASRISGGRFFVAPFNEAPAAVRRTALQTAFREVAGDGAALQRPQLKQLERLLMAGESGGSLSLPKAVRAFRGPDWILIARAV